MNELDARIDRMSAALRDEPMPAAPAGTMVAGRSRLRFAGRIAIVACAAVVAVAGAAVALYPRDSAAAVFERIVQSADSKPCRWICYDLEPNGAWKVTQDIYRDQSRFHSTHPDGGETYIEHGYWYMLSRDKSYVVVEPVKLRPGHSPFGRPSLREQLGFQNVEWVKDAGTAAWKGMILERYNVHSEIKREGGGIIDLDGFTLADPKSDLPYYSITTESGDLEGLEYQPRSSAMEWQ
ncbi:MAG TPA: hypothetical protein VMI31_11685, partial [Fimbriimonadaceae bacterium]|nr:hypothetical protein [Fimbriimonadaceae bacterium]